MRPFFVTLIQTSLSFPEQTREQHGTTPVHLRKMPHDNVQSWRDQNNWFWYQQALQSTEPEVPDRLMYEMWIHRAVPTRRLRFRKRARSIRRLNLTQTFTTIRKR